MCLWGKNYFAGGMTAIQATGSFANLSDRGWSDRAGSAWNRTRTYAFLFTDDGGGGTRYCLAPGVRYHQLGFASKTASSILTTFNKANLDSGCCRG